MFYSVPSFSILYSQLVFSSSFSFSIPILHYTNLCFILFLHSRPFLSSFWSFILSLYSHPSFSFFIPILHYTNLCFILFLHSRPFLSSFWSFILSLYSHPSFSFFIILRFFSFYCFIVLLLFGTWNSVDGCTWLCICPQTLVGHHRGTISRMGGTTK